MSRVRESFLSKDSKSAGQRLLGILYPIVCQWERMIYLTIFSKVFSVDKN